MNLSHNHRNLAIMSALVFGILSTYIAIMPANQMQKVTHLPGQNDLTYKQKQGLKVYVAENCMACHTQQVRSIEMDKTWGKRPSIPSDYYWSKKRMDVWRQSPSLLGSERTGPDLTSIGDRQPGVEWHLLHLYNPRLVVPESIMPAYSWYFQEKHKASVRKGEYIVNVPVKYLSDTNNVVIANQEVLYLVEYLTSLKQPSFAAPDVAFIEFQKQRKKKKGGNLNGKELYTNYCASCHQPDGTGVAGAFPPLKGSPIVNDDDYQKMVRIILEGYDARDEYAQMPPFMEQLTDEEIAAIVNHERSSWGNNASKIDAEKVKSVRSFIENLK